MAIILVSKRSSICPDLGGHTSGRGATGKEHRGHGDRRCVRLHSILIGEHTVPAFLAASWYATDDPYAERKQEWFVAHARGASFRSLDLPIDMTRKLEHVFLMSRDHLAIEQANASCGTPCLGGPTNLLRHCWRRDRPQISATARCGVPCGCS
jgi:hypothetical protein